MIENLAQFWGKNVEIIDDEQELLLSNKLKYKVLESTGKKMILEVVN